MISTWAAMKTIALTMICIAVFKLSVIYIVFGSIFK